MSLHEHVYTFVPDYVNNKALTESLSRWIYTRRAAVETGQPIPPLPDDVGEAILLIASNLAFRPNFSGYSFREDMIGQAILESCKYIHNFRPEKSNNAFSYITTIAFHSFQRTITVEKKKRLTSTKPRAPRTSKSNTDIAIVRESLAAGLSDAHAIANKTGLKVASVYRSIRRIKAKAVAA